MTDPIERLARHVTMARWQDLPQAAINAAKTFVLDTLGACILGSTAPLTDRMRRVVARWGHGNDATVIGAGMRLPAPAAAMINAAQAHSEEFDCVHERAIVHPLTTILPAALAAAERRGGVSGRTFLLSLAVGVNVSTTIGMAARSRLKFFRPATAGVFGATAAVAKLEGIDRAALMDAFGLAYNQAAGPMQAHAEGKPAVALQMGMAARAALNAVDLAAAGFPGPHQPLEGAFGYFRLMEGDWDIEPVFSELGKVWRVTEISQKPFPTGRATHAGIDGVQRLLAAGAFAPGEVERVTLLVPPLIHQLVGRPFRPDMDVSYARLSLPYACALALVKGTVSVENFRPAPFADAAIADLAARIEVVADDNPDQNALVPQTVRIAFKSGAVREVRIENMIGAPQNPLGRERHLEKFRQCWMAGGRNLHSSQGERLIDMVDRLEILADVGEIIRLVS